MITAAVWYVDQWIKHPFGGGATKHMMAPGPDREYEMMPLALLYALMTGGIPALHIAGTPYHKLADWTYDAYDYLDRTEDLHRRPTRLQVNWKNPLRSRITHNTVWLRRGLAKVATRALPGIGWALFAYDIYSVSKWYLETDF